MVRFLPRHIPADFADLSTNEEIATVERAYGKDIDAVITILDEIRHRINSDLEFCDVYANWFDDAVNNLKKERKISALLNIPKPKGRPIDRSIAERDLIIVRLVYLMKMEGQPIDEAYYTVNKMLCDSGIWGQPSDLAAEIFREKSSQHLSTLMSLLKKNTLEGLKSSTLQRWDALIESVNQMEG